MTEKELAVGSLVWTCADTGFLTYDVDISGLCPRYMSQKWVTQICSENVSVAIVCNSLINFSKCIQHLSYLVDACWDNKKERKQKVILICQTIINPEELRPPWRAPHSSLRSHCDAVQLDKRTLSVIISICGIYMIYNLKSNAMTFCLRFLVEKTIARKKLECSLCFFFFVQKKRKMAINST